MPNKPEDVIERISHLERLNEGLIEKKTQLSALGNTRTYSLRELLTVRLRLLPAHCVYLEELLARQRAVTDEKAYDMWDEIILNYKTAASHHVKLLWAIERLANVEKGTHA